MNEKSYWDEVIDGCWGTTVYSALEAADRAKNQFDETKWNKNNPRSWSVCEFVRLRKVMRACLSLSNSEKVAEIYIPCTLVIELI